MALPGIGQFVLHHRATPPFKAGDYTLVGDHDVAGGPTAEHRSRVRVTSPRFILPPDQILSTFPPANSTGAYETRLPQVVIKRRTLPWEREADPGDEGVPWLALVVIAEGEGTISDEVPVADCVTPGVVLDGPNDVATGRYLSVTQTVVDKVFPTAPDLKLLAHVRHVDTRDTELMAGDDDGFLAVVLANRLPQFDRAEERPVRYLACLVSIEGQIDTLPVPPPPIGVFTATQVVFDSVALAESQGQGTDDADTDMVAMGGIGRNAAATTVAAPAGRATPAVGLAGAENWLEAPRQVEQVALAGGGIEVADNVRNEMLQGFVLPLESLVLEPVHRFPVLAYWSFTCDGAGGFQSIASSLDVGMIGTLPADDAVPGQPAAPPSRPDPELVETGHVGLPHVTRGGEPRRAWYRGPFVPHVTVRDEPDDGGRLVLAHVADQLRRIVPDGREDLSLAAGFEIGRLLTLSQPSIVRALLAWRAEQFGAERARRLAESAAGRMASIRPALGATGPTLGALVQRHLVLTAAADAGRVLAPSRPVADPGRPLGFGADPAELLVKGLALPVEVGQDPIDRVVDDLVRSDVPLRSERPRHFGSVEAALQGEMTKLLRDVTKGRRGSAPPPTGPGIGAAPATAADDPPDALDRLIDRALEDHDD